MKNNNQYPKKSITIDGLSLYELCRWASLKDAIDIIAEKCDERNLDFNTFEIKPLDILKYVDTATDDLFHKVTKQQENEQIRT